MKRVLCFIFMVYFLALAVAPCGDADDCNEVKKSEMCQDDSQHEDETCTPFCVCSCCAAHFVMKDLHSHLKLVAVINTAFFPDKEAKTSAAIIPIWQPPKLS